jgi:signal peptidase I
MEKTITAKKQKKLLPEIYDWVESFAVAFLAVIVILTFVVRGTIVDGDSMLPTLQNRQFLVLSRMYTSPSHNDIIVIHAANMVADDGRSYGKTIIKRVIGIPGDIISIDSYTGIVYRNHQPLNIEYRDGVLFEDSHAINDYTFSRHNFPEGAELVVPDNHLFVLGDNRNNSIDSRASEVGMINLNYVIGKVQFRLSPIEQFGMVN